MDDKRRRRVEAEIQKVVSEIISRDLKDPRVSSLTSVTAVEITKDFQQAKLYISTLGDKREKEACIAGLEKSAGFIKKEIGQRIKLRQMPELIFKLDESLERGLYMDELISRVIRQDEENRKKYEDPEA